jgi:hypothetical protein
VAKTCLLQESVRKAVDSFGARLELGESRRLLDKAQASLAFPQSLLRLYAIGYVARETHVPASAVRQEERNCLAFDVNSLSFEPHDFVCTGDCLTCDNTSVDCESLVKYSGATVAVPGRHICSMS